MFGYVKIFDFIWIFYAFNFLICSNLFKNVHFKVIQNKYLKILTILLVAGKEKMISDKVWPGVKVMALGDQDFFNVLQSVDNDARQRSQPELDYLAIVKLNKVAESFVR